MQKLVGINEITTLSVNTTTTELFKQFKLWGRGGGGDVGWNLRYKATKKYR